MEENKIKKSKVNKTAQKESKISTIKDIPPTNNFTKEQILEIYKEELKRKDIIIDKLEKENKLLLEVTMRNAKRRLEE
jgi:hypothetical protein